MENRKLISVETPLLVRVSEVNTPFKVIVTALTSLAVNVYFAQQWGGRLGE